MTASCATEIGPLLLAHARHAITSALGSNEDAPPDAPELHERAATFVTLRKQGELRGCIGSVRAQRPLGEDVRHNAVAAATRDKRFAPVSREELPALTIEVSLLSEPEFVDFASETELCARLQPGIDGLIIFSGCRSATFLPQVWEQLPEPEGFLAALKQKAGLDPSRPIPNAMAATYRVTKWSEAPG
jgi:AmmeMemoRadiSam system protein A